MTARWRDHSASCRASVGESDILDEGQLREVVLFAKVGDGFGLRFEPGLVLQPSPE
jgi:hypothetical protein